GTRRGVRHVRGGRCGVRTVLYMAALAAARHNPHLKEFKGRLEKAGKKAKVVLTAVARKLVVLANAVLRSGRPYDPAFCQPCSCHVFPLDAEHSRSPPALPPLEAWGSRRNAARLSCRTASPAVQAGRGRASIPTAIRDDRGRRRISGPAFQAERRTYA